MKPNKCVEMVPLSVPNPHKCRKPAAFMVENYYTDEAASSGRTESRHVFLCVDCIDHWKTSHKQSGKRCVIRKL